jgi:hypothetical protein
VDHSIAGIAKHRERKRDREQATFGNVAVVHIRETATNNTDGHTHRWTGTNIQTRGRGRQTGRRTFGDVAVANVAECRAHAALARLQALEDIRGGAGLYHTYVCLCVCICVCLFTCASM